MSERKVIGEFRYAEYSWVSEKGTITVAAVSAESAAREVIRRQEAGEYDARPQVAFGRNPHEAAFELGIASEMELCGEAGNRFSMFNPTDPDASEEWVETLPSEDGMWMARWADDARGGSAGQR